MTMIDCMSSKLATSFRILIIASNYILIIQKEIAHPFPSPYLTFSIAIAKSWDVGSDGFKPPFGGDFIAENMCISKTFGSTVF